MNLQLASARNVVGECDGLQCKINQGFDRQVKRLGARLAVSAYDLDPHLKERIRDFKFFVAEKDEIGTASDASGNIVVYRGLYQPGLDEGVLAFAIAREMGRVMARHHDENSAASLVASVLVRLLLPVTNLASGAALLASTAASAAGAKAIAADGTPEKTREATSIAIDLLAAEGWRIGEVGDALLDYSDRLPAGDWRRSIEESRLSFKAMDAKRALLALDP